MKELDTPTSSDALLRGALRLSHMRMIVALEDTGQVSTAAQVMNISQPAASRMIAEMEELLQVPLCVRRPRGIELTAYGKALGRRARSILLEIREADREIADLRTGRGGTVFLGTVTAPAIELAVPAIKRLRERYPKIEINMQVDTSAALASELLASRHDFIIARVPDHLDPRLFDTRVIGIEKACLIVRREHPLMTGEPVPIESLSDYDWVFQPSGSVLRRALEQMFLSRGIALPSRMVSTASSLLTLVTVTQTDAIAPIAQEVATFINRPGGLGGQIGILPIAFNIEVRPYSLITARNRALSPAAQTLYHFVLEQTERI